MKHYKIPKKKRRAIYEKYNGHCAYCGREIAFDEMEVDHVIALSAPYYGDHVAQFIQVSGNMNADWNLMPACQDCNIIKGNHDVETFRSDYAESHDEWEGKFYYEKALIEKFNGK